MRCRKCGAQIPTDSKFCNYCGANINRIQTRDGSMPVRPRDENFDEIASVREEKIEEPENRGQRALTVFFIVLAAVIVTAVVLPIYIGIRNRQKPITIVGIEDNGETAGGAGSGTPTETESETESEEAPDTGAEAPAQG